MPIPSSCNLCNSDKYKQSVITSHVYGKKNSAFYKCDNCEVIYQYPQLSKKEEEFFYKKEFEKFMDNIKLDFSRAFSLNCYLNFFHSFFKTKPVNE